MIQTKTAVEYGARSERFGIIKVEVRPDEIIPEGQYYLVVDWDVDRNEAQFSKRVFWTNEQINNMEAYLEENYDFSRMTRIEKERRKLQLALMIDTQTNLLTSGKTIYGLTPNDWEFSFVGTENTNITGDL